MNKPVPHFNRVESLDGSAVLSGPTKAGPIAVGVFVTDRHLEELAKLLRYAEQRLDSGKVSAELKEAEAIVRRMVGWIAIVEEDKATSAEAHERRMRGRRLKENPE